MCVLPAALALEAARRALSRAVLVLHAWTPPCHAVPTGQLALKALHARRGRSSRWTALAIVNDGVCGEQTAQRDADPPPLSARWAMWTARARCGLPQAGGVPPSGAYLRPRSNLPQHDLEPWWGVHCWRHRVPWTRSSTLVSTPLSAHPVVGNAGVADAWRGRKATSLAYRASIPRWIACVSLGPLPSTEQVVGIAHCKPTSFSAMLWAAPC